MAAKPERSSPARYRLLEKIGEGGMAAVYRAKLVGAAGFEKTVAIKKILPWWAHREDFSAMLVDEAKTLVRLCHENIVGIFELDRGEDGYFFVMEYVDGPDLKSVLNALKASGRSLSVPLACFVAAEICRGLAYAHSRRDGNGSPLGLVHRDVSPHNVLIARDGRVKLADFGIAKLAGGSARTRSGALKGKFSYMAPEQAEGRPLDARADLFALGATLYETLTGRKCFDGDDDFSVLGKVKRAEVDWSPLPDARLKSILKRALAAERSSRYASAAAFESELRACCRGVTTSDLGDFLAGLTDATGSGDAPTVIARKVPPDPTLLHESTLCETRHQTTAVLTTPENTILQTPHPESAKRTNRDHLLSFKKAATVLAPLVILAVASLALRSDGHLVPDKPPPFTEARPPATLPEPEPSPAVAAAPTQTISPKPVFGRFLVSTEPADAAISLKIGGEELRAKGLLKAQRELSGVISATATIAAPGYRTQEIEMTLTPEQPESRAEIVLEKPRYGSLRVDARPWAIASVKGYGKKETPGSFTLPAGRHAVTLVFPPGKRSVTRVIEIPPEGTVRCRASFSAARGAASCS